MGEMTLIRDFEFPARADASSDTYLPDYDEMREDARREAAAYLKDNEDFLVAEGVRTVSILTIEGAVAKEIIGYAQTAPGAVIAISTHGCSGVQRWIPGSVSEKVVRHADDPVLVVWGE